MHRGAALDLVHLRSGSIDRARANAQPPGDRASRSASATLARTISLPTGRERTIPPPIF